MTKNLSFSEVANNFSEIVDFLEQNQFKEDGVLAVSVEQPGRMRLKILEADVLDALIRIISELESLVINNEGPDVFGLLQDSFEKFPLQSEEQKHRIGNAFLGFRARLGTFLWEWVPGAQKGSDEEIE